MYLNRGEDCWKYLEEFLWEDSAYSWQILRSLKKGSKQGVSRTRNHSDGHYIFPMPYNFLVYDHSRTEESISLLCTDFPSQFSLNLPSMILSAEFEMGGDVEVLSIQIHSPAPSNFGPLLLIKSGGYLPLTMLPTFPSLHPFRRLVFQVYCSNKSSFFVHFTRF